jgi:Zn-dependent membrane protease YugP
MFFDPVYFLFALPGILLALWASAKTKSTFSKYSRIASRSGMTGAEAASRLLYSAGITDVRIEVTDGFLSDHYDPTCKKLRLSQDVYHSSSLSAIGVACHEAGHAIQHATAYGPLGLRSALVPVINLTSPCSYILIFAGAFLSIPGLIKIGILCFAAAVVFAIVTLPVEYNASARAKALMVQCGIVSPTEAKSAGDVLNAAFLTYVASAVSALLTLLYYVWRFSSSRD